MAGDIRELTPEEITRRETLLDLVREGARLTAQEKDDLKELLALQGRRAGMLHEEAAILDSQLKKYSKLKESDDKRVLMAMTARDLAQANLDIAKQNLANAKEVTPELEKALAATTKELKKSERRLEIAKGTTKAIQDGAQAGRELGVALGSVFDQYGEHPFFNAKNIVNLGKVIRGGLIDKSMKPFDAIVGGIAGGSLMALTNSFISLMFEVDKTQHAFMRATGASEAYADSLTRTYEQTRLYGVELKDVQETMEDLFTTYTDFTMVTQTQREDLQKTGVFLKELGVSSKDFAQGIQNQTKMFGVNATAAAATSRELADLAQEIGVTPAKMGADFAAAGAGIAKLGSEGVRAFKDLAIVSKTTGLEINKLLAITDKFDTFEGAAEQAGKLNAALGGNFVNAMDLMTSTDPVERFEMIRDTILNAGLSFDDMSYYQRVFYKDALGLSDVSDLALMLSGDMSTLAGSTQKTTADYKRLRAESKRLQDVTQQFKSLMMSLIPIASDIIKRVQKWTDELSANTKMQDDMRKNIKSFTDALIVLGEGIIFVAENWIWLAGLWAGFKIVGILRSLGLITFSFGTQIPAAMAASGTATQGASVQMAGGIRAVGAAATSGAAGILALGFAVAEIGAGVYIAAVGLAELARAFGDAGDNGGWAALGIGLVLAAIVGMIAILAAMSPAAMTAAAGLAPLGLAILLIGAGVGLAALGIGEMAKGFAQMFANLTVEKIGALTLFGAVIGVLALAGGPAALALGALTLALVGFGLAVWKFPTDDLDPLTKFFVSVSMMGKTAFNLKLVAKSISEINNAISKLPDSKSVEFQSTMESLTKVTAAVNAGSTARAFQNANATATSGDAKTERPYIVQLELKLDGDTLSDKTFKLMAGKLAEEVLN